jgi:hypothetical protein
MREGEDRYLDPESFTELGSHQSFRYIVTTHAPPRPRLC